MTATPTPLRELLETAERNVAYSYNFATAKPNIGATERDHILGLCATINELKAALSARDEAGACNCASGRGAEHCVVHAPNDVLPSIATPPAASGEELIDANDNADYIEHCADRLARCGYRITGSVLRVIAAEYRRLAAVAPAGMDGPERAELERLRALINTPELHDFSRGVVLEAAHQRERWGNDHDVGKQPQDWFWLVGYLAGKALRSHLDGNTEKALHHAITVAAACANWHGAMLGTHNMRPGIDGEAALAPTPPATAGQE